MPMEDGIGRSGYRVLATLFYGLGAASIVVSAVTHDPATPYEWLAFGIGLAALTLLWVTAMFALVGPGIPRAAKPRPSIVAKRAPSPPAPTPAARDIEFEYAAPRAPERLVLPSAFQEPTPQADPKAWPERRTARITRGELARRYTEKTPLVREILTTSGATMKVPEILATPGRTAVNGMARGKCGGCGMIILAPEERPIRLRCPGCGKGNLLE